MAVTRHNIPLLLRRRRTIRVAIALLLVSLTALILIDHAGGLGFRGNDWSRFHQKTFRVKQVLSADQFVLEDGTIVQLLGVTPALHEQADRGKTYLARRLEGKDVALRLEPTQTRDSAGHLLAYVYFTDTDLINLDIVHDGQAFADRRTTYSLHQQIEQAENEARKKQRGMWKDLDWDDQPKWRQEWVKSLARRKSPPT
jgi:endonuclease YncB( thermonuclease family)